MWPSIGRAPEHDVVEVKAVLPNVAVIVLSSEPRDVEFLGVLHTGAVGYLPADIPAERLVQVLAAVADGEVAIPRQLVGRLVEEVKGRGITIDFTDEQPPVELTDREWEVLCGLRQGQSTRQIADELYISAATVRSHVASIVRKVGARDRDDAIRLLDGR